MSLVSTMVDYWLIYVFGNAAYAGVVVLSLVVLYGLVRGWSFDAIAVVFVPAAFLLANAALPLNLNPIILLVAGGIVGLAIAKILGGGWR